MQAEQKQILRSFIPPAVFILLLWIVKFIEIKSGFSLDEFGVLPRHLSGLKGIITSPLIHADWQHLISNSIPLLILGATLIYFYRPIAFKVFIMIYFLGGFWLWMGGRENYHIGASGLVYGLAVFIFFSGAFRRDPRLIAISLLVVFLYGSLIWGVFPLFIGVSWEAHLFGSCAGLLCAIVFRKEGPQRKVYEWEDENDTSDDEELTENNESHIEEDVRIKYHYQSKEDNSSTHEKT